MDYIFDKRINCYSVLLKMTLGEYLELISEAHSQKGGIEGQRDVLKTTTAKRIRTRMMADIGAGAVLPPVVIGVVIPNLDFAQFESKELTDEVIFRPLLRKYPLTIIDGMQRTAALIEAQNNDNDLRKREIRVEFWIAKSVSSLVYRMLVLNTGQVPWTLARQLSVVYSPLLEEIKQNVPEIDRIFLPDKPGRRVSSGQFSADALIELYLVFSLRKSNVDTKETLSEEFSRLDFVDNLATNGFQEIFYETLRILVNLDKSFEKYDLGNNARFSRGRDVFGSQPARIGFMVAVGLNILGRPGLDRSNDERARRLDNIQKNSSKLIEKLNLMNSQEVGEFLCLDILSEILDKRVGQVGRYERNVFQESFKVLVEDNFDLPNLEPCWRAS